MKLATAQQMRDLDHHAINEFGIPSIDLMENAALCVVDEIVKRHASPKNFAVLCGPGNNGGDGLAVARILTQDRGWTGSIWLVQTQDSKFSPDREANLERAKELGLKIAPAEGREFEIALQNTDIVIDAILGTASSGAPRKYVQDAIDAINTHAKGVVISLDLPTGTNCDTGEVVTDAVRADLTITLGFSKPGLHLSPANEYVGELVVRDDFLPNEIIEAHNSCAQVIVIEPEEINTLLPSRKTKRDSNKGTFGAIYILAGSKGFAGAACLAALGTARMGAGTVTLGVPNNLLDIVMTRAPEVVMTKGFGSNDTSQFQKSSVTDILDAVSKSTAIGLGPGIGHKEDDIRAFVLELIQSCEKPMVLDADALTIIAALGDEGAKAVKNRKTATILTPHPGEMGRLLGCTTQDVQTDRLKAVHSATAKYGCVVLLKGDRTLIADTSGRLAINETGNPGMASGGMGDILTGVAATCMAQIEDPFYAAATAAYIHGLAGDIARDEIGIAGFLATDVAQKIPQAITRCLRD